nr:immunoglobulin heavy chain junction region [Macaca mulatta]MOV39008.1 immunoglobulin heavy chain junction region [Macaca mulatta]MOV39884.1 immunoglobulin heavy chain junction region [Macaca mulatta]MOV43552.1 immunoglobulin heavy chain junction region [Macaca mulatta]MOV45592.1 immunoglobulin heavy chain junction region [Macaca mulatta]
CAKRGGSRMISITPFDVW